MSVSIRRIVSVICCGCLLAHAAESLVVADITLTRKPYIQQTTPHAAFVVWRTLGLGNPSLRYGTTPDTLTEVVSSGITKYPPINDLEELPLEEDGITHLASAPPNTYQHEFLVKGLEPSTRYFYGVYDGEVLLAGGTDSHYMQTLPLVGSEAPQRFWVVGDSGDGGLLQWQAFQAVQAQVAASGREIDAYLHLGDMAYNFGDDAEFQTNFFDVYETLLRNTVTWPTMGNHEGASSSGISAIGPYFDAYVVPTRAEAGGVPSGSESYYSFDSGSIHFVCLNSHDLDRLPSGEMALWLREDLGRATAKWLIAFFHHPPYTKGTHDSDWEHQLVEMREHIMPILESHGVDLVLAGHSHTYERSMLIDGAYATPTVVDGVVYDDGDGDPGPSGDGPYRKSEGLNPNEGTIAVVAGNGRGAVQSIGTMPVMRQTIPQTGSLLLDVDGDTLTGYMINWLSQIPDRFQIIKSGSVDPPERLAYPWRPFGPRVTTALLGERRLKIIITPNPPAPDAEVYYTLDGSPPTLGSAKANGPIVVEQDVFLRTFSSWRGDTRQSPETQTGWLRRHQLVGVRTPILSGEDDAVEDDGVLESEGDSLTLGDGIVALSFPELQLPQDITISRAYVQFTAASASSLPGAVSIHAEAQPNAAGLVAGGHPLAPRTRTISKVMWMLPPWLFTNQRSSSQRTPDLSGLIQEVIGIDGWSPGGTLNLFLEKREEEGVGTRELAASESGSDRAPFLVINYEQGFPENVAASQPPHLYQFERSGELVSRLTFRRYTGEVSGGELQYAIEGSKTMMPGSWLPATDWEELDPPSLLFGPWQFYRFERTGDLDGDLFIRFRVTAP